MINLYESLKPLSPENGFKMEGYYIWGGSAIKGDDGKYYLFASRWPKTSPFPEGYMTNSEIVLATSNSPEGPYEFQKVIIGKRDGGYFDSVMAHNPHIKKIGDTYYLFYIGSCDGSQETRAIGYAKSKNLVDFERSDKPIDLPANANNPSVLVMRDGKILLVFRDGKLKVTIAKANKVEDGFRLLAYDIFDGKRAEDMYIFNYDSKLHIIAEDNVGAFTGNERFGFHVVSTDLINWEKAENVLAYDHTLKFADGTEIKAQRRERPQLLFDETGKPTHLFTSVLYNGEAFNAVQPIDINQGE